MKIGAGNYTFLKKAVFYPYKKWILPHKPPLLVKAIFMANRKGLLRDWKTLMTDNNLDLNDLIPKIASLHCQQKITLPKQK